MKVHTGKKNKITSADSLLLITEKRNAMILPDQGIEPRLLTVGRRSKHFIDVLLKLTAYRNFFVSFLGPSKFLFIETPRTLNYLTSNAKLGVKGC